VIAAHVDTLALTSCSRPNFLQCAPKRTLCPHPGQMAEFQTAPQRRRAGGGSFELVARVSTVAHATRCNESDRADVSLTPPSNVRAAAGPLLTKCARVAVSLPRGCMMSTLLLAANADVATTFASSLNLEAQAFAFQSKWHPWCANKVCIRRQ
jgi:hypothetical protein